MTKKCITILFGILLLGLPFEHDCIHIFRPFSRSLLHKFEAMAPFAFIVPKYFEKHLHFYISDILIVLILSLMLIAFRPRLKELTFEKSSRYLTLLWVAALLSLIFSVFSQYYFQYFNLLNLGIIFFAFHLTRFFFQERQKIIRNLLWGCALISAFECFVGIWQFFTQAPVGIFMLGEPPLHLDGPHLTVIPLTEKTRQLIEWFHPIPIEREALIRAYGTFLHPNLFGEYLSISLLVSYYLFTQEKRRYLRLSLLFLITLQIFGLSLSFSRAAFLSWGIGTVIWLALMLSKQLSVEKRRMWPLVAVISVVILLSFAILFPQFHARGGFFNYTNFVQSGDSIRLIYQDIALNMMKTHPLLGIGYNCFVIAPSSFFQLDPHHLRTWTHNIYLLIGSEMGLLGLGCFFLFIASLLSSCLKQPFTPLSITLFAIFVGFLVVGLFDFYFLVVQAGKLMFFLFSGILAAQFPTKTKILPSLSQA